MACDHDQSVGTRLRASRSKSITVDLDRLSQALGARKPDPKKDSRDSSNTTTKSNFYSLPAINETLKQSLPWKHDVHYFQKVYISAIALTKMTLDAKSGGSIEVMGMITGKIIEGAIVVMDVYALPVEGTETRVNAQAEGYEYMVQFLEASKKLGTRNENIVGWYHSHPGYGCWLSGIDVSTQSLNQNFQDPYLALVIDPVKTASQNKVEIGAFRTYPDNYLQNLKDSKSGPNGSTSQSQKHLPKSKQKDFGIHADKYYSLGIEIFHNELDANVIATTLKSEDNNSAAWLKHLLTNKKDEVSADLIKHSNVEVLVGAKSTAKHNQSLLDNLQVEDESFRRIQELTGTLQKWDLGVVRSEFHKKFEQTFESLIYRKLLVSPKSKIEQTGTIPSLEGTSDDSMEDDTEGSDEDESDLEGREDKEARGLDVSDVEDAISVESSSVNKNEDDEDLIDEDEELEETRTGKKERRGYVDETRGGGNRRSLGIPKERTRSRARSPVRTSRVPKLEQQSSIRSRHASSITSVHDEQRSAKLKKNGGRDVAELVKLSGLIGQHDIQTLLTHDIQNQLFGPL